MISRSILLSGSLLAMLATASLRSQTSTEISAAERERLKKEALDAVNKAKTQEGPSQDLQKQAEQQANQLKNAVTQAKDGKASAENADKKAEDIIKDVRDSMSDEAKQKANLLKDMVKPGDPKGAKLPSGKTEDGAPLAAGLRKALTPTPAGPAVAAIIECEGTGFYDDTEALAVFTEDVRFTQEATKIWCDQLDVYMNKPEEAKKAGAAATPGSAKPNPAADKKEDAKKAEMDSESIKQAVARGALVTIVRQSPQGQIVATCKEAYYNGLTGQIILRGRPQVQQLRIFWGAETENTDLIIEGKTGRVFTKGKAQIFKIMESDSEAASKRAELLRGTKKSAGPEVPDPLPAVVPQDVPKKENKDAKPATPSTTPTSPATKPTTPPAKPAASGAKPN